VDDGSNDGTAGIIESLALSEKRVRFAHRQSQPAGAATCRNIGLSLAKGKYVMFLDSDDLLTEICLEQRVDVMEQNLSLDFAVFPTMIFNDVPGDTPYYWNAFSDEDDLERFFRFDIPWCTFGPIWRKASLQRVGPWDERALSWQDWEFHVRALAEGLKYIKVAEPDSYCRETRAGTISHASKQRRYVLNRSRVLPSVLAEVSTRLRIRDSLTPRRRRLLAALFYKNAFSSGLSHRKALMIWRRAKNAKVISRFKFQIVLICCYLLGRIPWKIRVWMFPEVRLIGSARKHMRSEVSVSGEANGVSPNSIDYGNNSNLKHVQPL
jgi:glycosyltransferase involved in cell wall biosynthesis